MATRGLFHRAHYNGISKDIREQYQSIINENGLDFPELTIRIASCTALVELAIRLAKRFETDNPEFDPVSFLNQCSPNVDLYPIGELWNSR